MTSKGYDENLGVNPDDPTLYRKLIGKLLYLTITRSNIIFLVQSLNQHMQSPKKSHLNFVYRIIRYIKNKPGLGILLSSDSNIVIQIGVVV